MGDCLSFLMSDPSLKRQLPTSTPSSAPRCEVACSSNPVGLLPAHPLAAWHFAPWTRFIDRTQQRAVTKRLGPVAHLVGVSVVDDQLTWAPLVKRACQPNARLHGGQLCPPWNLCPGDRHLAPERHPPKPLLPRPARSFYPPARYRRPRSRQSAAGVYPGDVHFRPLLRRLGNGGVKSAIGLIQGDRYLACLLSSSWNQGRLCIGAACLNERLSDLDPSDAEQSIAAVASRQPLRPLLKGFVKLFPLHLNP